MNHMETTGRDEREADRELARDEAIQLRGDAIYIELHTAVEAISKEAAHYLSDLMATYAETAAIKEIEAEEKAAGEP